MKKYEHLIHYLKENHIFFKEDYLIKYDTYFKTGGRIKIFIAPQDYRKFKNVIVKLRQDELDYKIIGNTSNIILLDEIEYSIIVSTKNLSKLEVVDSVIHVEAGYSLQDFVRVALINQAKGFEGLEGIPGSIGGAIFMNAEAYGDAISDNLISVECIAEDNSVLELKKNECGFSYRDSIFRDGKIAILRAKFKLVRGNRDDIARNIENYHIARHSYQDYVYPNLGSMISTKSNLYYLILKNDSMYYFFYWILKYLYKNPIVKFINRKRPNNIVFNKLLLKYLFSKQGINLKYTLSTKSANILVHDGTVDICETLNYIYLMHNLIGEKYSIENEVILEPVFSIKEDFEGTYKLIKEKQG